MARITNQSDFQLSIVGSYPGKDGPEPYKYRLPRASPDKKKPSVEVPDNHAKHWVRRSKADKRGLVTVHMGAKVVTNASELEPEPDAADTVPIGKLEDLHWRSAVAEVAKEDDLDVLESMHELEKRPRVIEAIEERMAELQE